MSDTHEGNVGSSRQDTVCKFTVLCNACNKIRAFYLIRSRFHPEKKKQSVWFDVHSQDYCSLFLSSSLPKHFRDSCDQSLLSVGWHGCQHAARMNQNLSSEESIEIYWLYPDKKDNIIKCLYVLKNKLYNLLVLSANMWFRDTNCRRMPKWRSHDI